MKRCPYCSAQNPDDAYFCSNCGYIITPESADVTGDFPQPGAPHLYPEETGLGTGSYPGPHYWQPPVQATVNSNGKAIASLVLAIFSIVSCPIVCSIIALILGYQARNEIAASRGWQTGESLAKAGIIIAWIGIAFYVLLIIVIAIVAAASSSSFSLAINQPFVDRVLF